MVWMVDWTERHTNCFACLTTKACNGIHRFPAPGHPFYHYCNTRVQDGDELFDRNAPDITELFGSAGGSVKELARKIKSDKRGDFLVNGQTGKLKKGNEIVSTVDGILTAKPELRRCLEQYYQKLVDADKPEKETEETPKPNDYEELSQGLMSLLNANVIPESLKEVRSTLSSLERANKAQQQKLAKLETLASMVAKHKSKNIGEFVSLVLNWQEEGTDFSFGEWEKKNFDQVVDCAKNIFDALFGKCGLMSQPILEDTRLQPSVVQEKLETIVKCITELHKEPPSTPRTRNLEQDKLIEEQASKIKEMEAQIKQLSADKKKKPSKRKRTDGSAPPPPPPLPPTSPSKLEVDLSGNSDDEEGGGDGDNGGKGVGTGGGDGDNDDEDGGISGKGGAPVHRRLDEKLLLASPDLFKAVSGDPENTDVVLSSNVVLPFKLLKAYSEVRAFPSVADDHNWAKISFVESLMNDTLNDVRDNGGLGKALDEKGDAVITKFLAHFNFTKKTFSAEEKETLIESLITLEKKLTKSNKSKYFVLVHYPPPH